MEFMYITNNPSQVSILEKSGVDRIFVDLEMEGKLNRQGHLNTHITNHKKEDILKVKKNIKKSKLLVRVNPMSNHSKIEIDYAIENGADIIMLPMFKTKDEVEKFVSYVDKRARVCLLLETSQAFVRIDQILEVEGIDEIHIGLNDLHLSLGLDFMFELLSEGIVEYLIDKIRKKNISYGFGGVAPLGKGLLDSSYVIKEHIRLGSNMVILSRDFRKNDTEGKINQDILNLKRVVNDLSCSDTLDFVENQIKVKEIVKKIVKAKQI